MGVDGLALKVYNIRYWDVPEINVKISIAEEYKDNPSEGHSTVTVNPFLYEKTKEQIIVNDKLYAVYQLKSFYSEFQDYKHIVNDTN